MEGARTRIAAAPVSEPGIGRGGLADLWLRAARGQDAGVAGRLLIALLVPLEWLYRIGLAAYLWLERIGVRKRAVLPGRVVSVGNLTLGGTGKTGLVEAVARSLAGDVPLVVLLRGYGAGHSAGPIVVSTGCEIRAGWKEAGDEAFLLARNVPGLRVVSGKDRRISGRLAIAELGASLIVLDDGLQYWQLSRDADIVLVDARSPFGNGHVMPAGLLREPLSGLRRASAVVLTHVNEVSESDLDALEALVNRMSPGVTVFRARYRGAEVLSATGVEPVGALRGRTVVALSGIGSPSSFAATLREEGADVVKQLSFPDHHPFVQADVGLAEQRRIESGAAWIVTTVKDYVRMEDLALPDSLRVLRADLEIEQFDTLLEIVRGRGN